MKRIGTAVAIALCLAIAGQAQAGLITPVNDGFDDPNLGGGYDYGSMNNVVKTNGVWTFVNGSGIAANGSAFGVVGATNGNVSNGDKSASGQAAFLQNGDGGTDLADGSYFFQDISGFPASTASVTFSIENRGNWGGVNPIKVMLDNQDLGTYTGVMNGFTVVTTPSVNVTAGSHTLYFIGTNGVGDNTAFIDNVSINPAGPAAVPEPASLTLFGIGALGMLGYGWRRRKAPVA